MDYIKMRKIFILILGLSLVAASCDVNNLFDFNAGTRGVIKSEDGGETFSSANKLKTKGDLNSTSVNTLAFDPTNPDILYLGSPSGIYKSEDGAKSWNYILSGLAVSSLAVDHSDANIIYAVGMSGQNGKIIKSADKGKSWVDIYTEPSKNNAVLAIVTNPSDSSMVLASLAGGEIISSTDFGRTWQTSKDLADRVIKLDFMANSLYALTQTKGLHRSHDLGLNWTQITAGLSSTIFSSLGSSSPSVSVYHDFVLDKRQAGVIYLGTEQGLFRSVNDGGTWAVLTLPVKNGGLSTTALAVNPVNSNNLLATIDGTIFKSVNGGLTWGTKRLQVSAQIHTIVFNPQQSNLIYIGVRNP